MAKSKKQEAAEAAPKNPPAEASPQAAAAKRPAKKAAAKEVSAPAGTAPAASAAPPAGPAEASDKPAAAQAPKAAKGGAKKPGKPQKQGQEQAGTEAPPAPAFPTIDTGLAAQAAASMVVHRDRLGGGSDTTAAQPQAGGAEAAKPAAQAPAKPQESTTFNKLKQGLNKPAGGALGGLFGPAGGQKKSNQPFGGGGPNFRNQTTGGFNRTGVPRRTGG